jgi:pimeloyl-ACP methyl ester carboxylesterase
MTSNIIFVHGAWANGSAWAKVLPLIEAAGLTGVAVHMPMANLDGDVAVVKRAIELVDGPVLLVGHSYGGVVISEAGDDPKVAGLVYIAAFGPDVGESAGSLGAGGPKTPAPDEMRPDAYGFLKLTKTGIDEFFAQDLSPEERALILSSQGPVNGAALGGEVTKPAWKTKPSWYVLAENDHTIHPELQAMMSKRMDAKTTRVAASHVPMLSLPQVVADIIINAAR